MANPRISIRLQTDMLETVNKEAKKEKLNRTEFINKAIAYYLIQKRGVSDNKDDDLSVILSALNDINGNVIESKQEIKNFISSLEEAKHVQETFEYKMYLRFAQRICAGIATLADKDQSAALKTIFKDKAIWELLS